MILKETMLKCMRKLRALLGRIPGVKDVKVNIQRERVVVTFDARKSHAPDLYDAILKSGYKPASLADTLWRKLPACGLKTVRKPEACATYVKPRAAVG